MTRAAAITLAAKYFDSGVFQHELARRVSYRTESQDASSAPIMRAYLAEAIVPDVERLGFATRIIDNPESPGHPFLIAHRHEEDGLPTVLTYGHADVQFAHAEDWRDGLDPWRITVEEECWYGRGSADNKGQHTVNLGALAQVLSVRGDSLGFNVTLLIDTGEEVGSPGLKSLCERRRDELRADLFIGSDGPRLAAESPTLVLGSRGACNFSLSFTAREDSHHSGNWGGVLSNPATVIANAVASIVDGRGRLLVEGLRPSGIPASVRTALSTISTDALLGASAVDDDWGEPGLTVTERLFGWNTIEVLAMSAGNPEGPVNAIPAEARAFCQLRYVVGTNAINVENILREHLDEHGYRNIKVEITHSMAATRLDPEDPWVRWALDSVAHTTNKQPALLPNLGGSLPNEAFADVLGLPTIWIPHSYPGCAQHAPNEHVLAPLMREALQIMAGLFWDLGEPGLPVLPNCPPTVTCRESL